MKVDVTLPQASFSFAVDSAEVAGVMGAEETVLETLRIGRKALGGAWPPDTFRLEAAVVSSEPESDGIGTSSQGLDFRFLLC